MQAGGVGSLAAAGWEPHATDTTSKTAAARKVSRCRAAKEIAPGKKSRQKKPSWVHNFDILEVKYGVLLEMVSCFPPHTTLGVGKKNGWETKFGVLLEML